MTAADAGKGSRREVVNRECITHLHDSQRGTKCCDRETWGFLRMHALDGRNFDRLARPLRIVLQIERQRRARLARQVECAALEWPALCRSEAKP